MIVQDKIALDFAEFTLIKDRVICIDYLTEEPLNVKKGIRLVETVQKLSNGEPCVVIHNVGDKYIFTTEALRFMGSQLDTENHKYLARAIVTVNPAARIASNNFIKLLKPIVPTKIFAGIDLALDWADELAAFGK